MPTKPAKPPKKTASKPKKTAKRKPTAKQIEAQKKQKALNSEFKKQQRRIKNFIKRASDKGFEFEPKLLDNVAKVPKRITPASIRRLERLNADALYKKSSKVFEIDGELVKLVGEQARKQERAERARKAKVTRMLSDYIQDKKTVPTWENEFVKKSTPEKPTIEEWAPDKVNTRNDVDDGWHTKGVKKIRELAPEESIAQRALNDMFILNNFYMKDSVPTLYRAMNKILLDVNKSGVVAAYKRYVGLGLPELRLQDFASNANTNADNLHEFVGGLYDAGFIDKQEFDEIKEEIEANAQEELYHAKERKMNAYEKAMSQTARDYFKEQKKKSEMEKLKATHPQLNRKARRLANKLGVGK